MNSNNRLPNDDHLQAAADETWTQMESGEGLGQAIRDSIAKDLPAANPQLRQLLTEQLEKESPRNKVTPARKTLAGDNKSSGIRWGRWALALSVCLVLGSACWALMRPAVFSPFAANHELGKLIHSGPVVNLNPQMITMGGGGPPGTEPSNSRQPTAKDYRVDERKVIPNRTLRNEFRMQVAGEGPTTYSFQSPKNVLEPQDRYQALREHDGFGFDALKGRNVLTESVTDDFSDSKTGEVYNPIYENQFLPTRGDQAISTFSIDVDTASYANMRRFLNAGQRPPADSVRIEELINYFSYDYPQPQGDAPFSVNLEVASCPWNTEHQLVRVGLKGQEIQRDERPVSNLVFLLDVSGSMNNPDKLPLLKRGLRMMIDQLNENDRISIVTYAGNAGVVLEPTSGDQKKMIHEAIQRLSSGGSTHGSAGIEKAYDLAVRNFIDGGVNRVIWATDGDLNVGITDDQTLIDLVSERAPEGVFLSTLGFGTGNLKDGKLEQIANKGNGIYAYIDGMREAHKVLVQQMSGSLVTIAKDVKLQIEFNPAEVFAYRLIGYENRMLATEDFDNDAKDAGEIGAGHTVTAIYEIVPAGLTTANESTPSMPLKYQTAAMDDQEAESQDKDDPLNATDSDDMLTDAAKTGELLTLALRYKQPDANESKRIEFVLENSDRHFDEASNDFRFAASVAGFGMWLRGSKFRGSTTPTKIENIASGAVGDDQSGYRAEFLDLVRRAK